MWVGIDLNCFRELTTADEFDETCQLDATFMIYSHK